MYMYIYAHTHMHTYLFVYLFMYIYIKWRKSHRGYLCLKDPSWISPKAPDQIYELKPQGKIVINVWKSSSAICIFNWIFSSCLKAVQRFNVLTYNGRVVRLIEIRIKQFGIQEGPSLYIVDPQSQADLHMA